MIQQDKKGNPQSEDSPKFFALSPQTVSLYLAFLKIKPSGARNSMNREFRTPVLQPLEGPSLGGRD